MSVQAELAEITRLVADWRNRVTTIRGRRNSRKLEATAELRVPITELDLLTQLASSAVHQLAREGRSVAEVADIELKVAVHRGELAARELEERGEQ